LPVGDGANRTVTDMERMARDEEAACYDSPLRRSNAPRPPQFGAPTYLPADCGLRGPAAKVSGERSEREGLGR
jgi:hypothetical protein